MSGPPQSSKAAPASSSFPLGYLATRLWRVSAGRRGTILAYLTLFLLASCVTLFWQPLVWARVMNEVQRGGVTAATLPRLGHLLGLILLAEVVFWACHGPARVLERLNGFRAGAALRKGLLEGVMELPLEWHAEHHSGHSIDRINKGAAALKAFAESSFQTLYALLELFGSLVILAWFSPLAAGLAMVVMGLSLLVILRFDRRLVPQYRELNAAENGIAGSIFDALSNITTVVILRLNRLLVTSLAHRIDRPLGLVRRNAILNEGKWCLASLGAAAMTTLVLGTYLWQQVQAGAVVLVGTVFLLIKYLGKISETLHQFTSIYSDLVVWRTQLENAEELAADFRPAAGRSRALPAGWTQIRIEDLAFTYPGTAPATPHLAGVSLTVHRGERLALVGASGSGKTSFLKVMRDLYHPSRIRLSVDGAPVPDGFPGIAEAIALVPQHPEIFATTVGENITLGAEHSPADVAEAIRLACFDDVVRRLPRGLDSSLKERGVNLSGGQQQRLALARGLLACADKELILLDEPTSSVDGATELRIYRQLFEACRGRTVISSIHRLHLLSLFDRICFFDHGRLVAAGPLPEMLAGCRPFRDLWQDYHAHAHEPPREGPADPVAGPPHEPVAGLPHELVAGPPHEPVAGLPHELVAGRLGDPSLTPALAPLDAASSAATISAPALVV